jgi:hypothetical protein
MASRRQDKCANQLAEQMAMRFKYQRMIDSLENCPPAHYESREFTAYRFVFEDLTHQNNFLPVLEIKPKRINAQEFVTEQAKCLGYALSLFDSLEHAQRRHQQISRYNKNFYKKVGTHVAEGEIASTDGVASPVDENGHISLHEFEGVNLQPKFRVVVEVYDARKS